MFPDNSPQFQFGLLGGVLLLAVLAAPAAAQQLPRGFEKAARAAATNEELVRQPDVWVMEVQYKQMRMTWVDRTDPETGEQQREQIWYLVWRAINRPVSGRIGTDTRPVNQLDPLPGPTQFIPEFTLVVYDKPDNEIPEQILTDEVIPEADENIRKVERQRLKNSVSVVQDLPEPVPADAEEQPWIYGVATWRGVDPETDFFKVIMSGFSNAYQIKDPNNGEAQVWRRVIVQRFYRPGDRFDPTERDFYFSGDPEWIYRPDAGTAAPVRSASKTDSPR